MFSPDLRGARLISAMACGFRRRLPLIIYSDKSRYQLQLSSARHVGKRRADSVFYRGFFMKAAAA